MLTSTEPEPRSPASSPTASAPTPRDAAPDVVVPSPALPPGRLKTEASALTHAGTVRRTNEDQFLVANLTSAMQVIRATSCEERTYFGPRPASLFAVADGMGGHAAGEEASALALASVESFVLEVLGHLEPLGGCKPEEVLTAAFRRADAAIHAKGDAREKLRGMGATMTMALFQGRTMHVAHAGDCRAYLLRDKKLYRVTRDHTLVAELKRKGLLTPEQAHEHPLKHIVTNVVGGGTLGVDPEVTSFPVRGGDRFMICSDGLLESVTDPQIEAVLTHAASPGEACGALVEAALQGVARDNITVVAVSFEEESLSALDA